MSVPAMESADSIIRNLAHLCSGDLAILCGAGISAPAGLPLASSMLRELLTRFDIDGDDLVLLLDSHGNFTLPFESCMDVVLDNAKNQDILELFRSGAPQRAIF